MLKRNFVGERKTSETSVSVKLDLDGGPIQIATGIGFLDHMLTLFAKHGGFGLEITAGGDTFIDFHHTTEDVGILLGKAFCEAVGDKVGINRYGCFLLPMDETLAETAVDFSGRPYLAYCAPFDKNKIGDFDTELVEEFWRAFVNNAKINLHIIIRSGTNSHHISEAIFKSAARAMKEALKITGTDIPSTKGSLD